ncbi:MAG: class I tRNA ligase family protein, partial [Flavobacteriales bacterium]
GAARTRAKEATFREFHLDAPVVELTPVVEKMSKSKFNVVNPDDIIERYGADTLRLYEMFLGPVEQSKPWDTNGIEGTYRFLRKFWNLFHLSTEASANAGGAEGATPGQAWSDNALVVTDEAPTKPELKLLHATLKKVTEDIEKMSFNTSVAQFMIAANELGSLKCNKRSVLEPLVIALAPFAPHIAEELWEKLGHSGSVTTAKWPQWQAEHLVEDSFSYPISFNGKTRLQLEFPIALDAKSVEEQVLANPEVQARLEGKAPKKVIVVPKRIVNIVV